MTTSNNADHEIYDQPHKNNTEQSLPDHSILGEPEPWESWETRLCLWSIGIGITALFILGVLVDWFLLPS